MLKILLNFIVFGTIGIAIAYEFYFSPKAQIKRLWSKIHKMSLIIGKINNDSALPDYQADPYKSICNKAGAVINSLLDYYFDPEEDAEFIKEHTYIE